MKFFFESLRKQNGRFKWYLGLGLRKRTRDLNLSQNIIQKPQLNTKVKNSNSISKNLSQG